MPLSHSWSWVGLSVMSHWFRSVLVGSIRRVSVQKLPAHPIMACDGLTDTSGTAFVGVLPNQNPSPTEATPMAPKPTLYGALSRSIAYKVAPVAIAAAPPPMMSHLTPLERP